MMFAKLFYVIVFIAFFVGLMLSKRRKKAESNRWDLALLILCFVMTIVFCYGNFRLSVRHSTSVSPSTVVHTYPDRILEKMVSWWSNAHENPFVRPKFIDLDEGIDETRYILAGLGCVTASICGWLMGMYSRIET